MTYPPVPRYNTRSYGGVRCSPISRVDCRTREILSLLTHALCYRLHEVKGRYDDERGRTGVHVAQRRNSPHRSHSSERPKLPLPGDFSDSKSGATSIICHDRAPLILRYPPPGTEPRGVLPSSFCRRRCRRTPALCCLSLEDSASPVVFLKKYNRPHRFLSFFFWFIFLCFSFSLCEQVLRVFVVSSFHLRGRRHRSSSRTGRRVDFRVRRRRSLLSNIRGRAPCRVAGSPSPGERRPGAAETGNTLYAVCARRDRFADTSYREPAIVLDSHPRLPIFIRAPSHLREK